MMEFQCRSANDKWKGIICNLKRQSNTYEFWIKSRSSIMVVFGTTSRGGFACFPDFQAGCHLTDLKDKFWNTEQLVAVLGEVDGLTVSAALFKLADKISI
jgi:hypothetical protein